MHCSIGLEFDMLVQYEFLNAAEWLNSTDDEIQDGGR